MRRVAVRCGAVRIVDPAERDADPAGRVPYLAAQFLVSPGRQTELEAGDRDGPGAHRTVVEDRRADADDALGVLLVVQGVADPGYVAQMRQEGRRVGDGAGG